MRQVGELGPPLAAPDEALADAGIDLLLEEVALLGGQNASHAILHWLASLDRKVERPSAEGLSLVRPGTVQAGFRRCPTRLRP